MFKVDPRQARTDLYDIGKGAAQVFDLSPLREQAAQERQQNFVTQQQEKKAAQGKEDDVNTQLSKLNNLAVLPREREMFAAEQAALYEDVKKNIGKIRSGDNAALLEIQQKIGNIYTKAELSKNTREQLEKYGASMLSNGFDKYRKQSVDYFNDYVTNPKYNGDYSFDPSQIVENYDYAKHFQEDLFPYAAKVAGANEKGYTSNFTLEQANKTIEDDLLSDPVRLRQANDDFEAATDKLGAKDGIDFIKKKYAPKLVIKSTKPTPQWMNDNDSDKKINVTNTTRDKDGGEMHVMNKTTNEEVTVKYDKDGNVIGGVQKMRLTPSQKSENDKVFSSNIAKQKAYHNAVRAAEIYKATIDPNTMDEDQIAAANRQLEAMTPDKNDPAYAETPLPYQEQDIQLTAKEAQEVAHDKFGVKPREIISGKAPRHVDVQHLKDTKTSVKKDWSKYKRK